MPIAAWVAVGLAWVVAVLLAVAALTACGLTKTSHASNDTASPTDAATTATPSPTATPSTPPSNPADVDQAFLDEVRAADPTIERTFGPAAIVSAGHTWCNSITALQTAMATDPAPHALSTDGKTVAEYMVSDDSMGGATARIEVHAAVAHYCPDSAAFANSVP